MNIVDILYWGGYSLISTTIPIFDTKRLHAWQYNKPLVSLVIGEPKIFSELQLDGNTDCALPMLSLSRCLRRSLADVGFPLEA